MDLQMEKILFIFCFYTFCVLSNQMGVALLEQPFSLHLTNRNGVNRIGF